MDLSITLKFSTAAGFGAVVLITAALVFTVIWNLKIIRKIDKRRVSSYRDIVKLMRRSKRVGR